MREKTDLRILKTKKALYKSLIKLMKDKPFKEIKVSDICEDSLINRSTFYSHYNDKYELLVDYINSLKTELLEVLEKNEHLVNTKRFYLEMIKLILDHFDEEKNVYYSILIHNTDNIITDILLDVAVKDINKRIKISNLSTQDIPTEIFVTFYLGAVASTIIEWLRTKDKYSKKEIILYLDKLIPEDLGK